jgi:isopentenyl-diphosphate delta-isomerase type 1
VQRSGVKITFPYIWANTCCSHPLSVPSELIEDGAMGVKNAARRKLEHELGIPPEDVPLESFTWLTRVHYVGASEPGDGSEPVWGEHEIDWILMCTPPATPRMALNENEVEATRAFTQAELREWMATRHSRGEEVSPWFGVMEASGLIYKWWDAVLARNLPPVFERGVIHRQHDLEALARGVPASKVPVQPAIAASARLAAEAAGAAAPVSRGGAGAAASGSSSSAAAAGHLKASSVDAASAAGAASAASSSGARKAGAAAAGAGAASGAVATPSSAAVIPGATASTPKQGAYGKVRIHSESLLSQLSHLDEVVAAAAFKLGWTSATKVKPLSPTATESEVRGGRGTTGSLLG